MDKVTLLIRKMKLSSSFHNVVWKVLTSGCYCKNDLKKKFSSSERKVATLADTYYVSFCCRVFTPFTEKQMSC